MIEANTEEIEKEMQEIDCGNQLENGILDNWMEEIVRCGRRMFSSMPSLSHPVTSGNVRNNVLYRYYKTI